MVRLSISATVLLASSLAAGASAQTAVLQPGETLLEVQAEGTTTYLPDAAFINVGVVSTGDTARAATEANAMTMTGVIAALKRAGVVERYIRSQQINVEPRFARANPQDYQEQAHITGYVARNSVSVTVTKLSIAPDVIGAAFAAGANSVSGPNLGSVDPQKGIAETRSDALAQARAEADTYAKGLGMRIVRVIRVSERGNTAMQVSYAVSRVSSRSVPPAPPLAGGEMQRTATVWIDYALAPGSP